MSGDPATTWSTAVVVFGFDLAAKVTAMLMTGLIVQWVLARSRASLGSTAGNACLIGLLLLPFSARVLPTMEFACLPAGVTGMRPRARSPAVTDFRLFELDKDVMADAPTQDRPAVKSTAKPGIIPRSNAGSRPSARVVSHSSATPSVPADWPRLGLAVYATVTVVLLIRLLASVVAVARLRAASHHVVDGPWSLTLDQCRHRLGIDRAVDLVWSPRVNVPLALGWIKPTIVLPTPPSGMSPSGHADAILLHELAHVRRGDYPWNVFLRFVQAVYWPHPLIWLLGRAIAELRERACDDLCIHDLGGPSAYRDTLLAVADGLSHRAGMPLGLAMARASRLGRRLARIEQSRGDSRCLPSLSARLATAGIAAAMAVALGPIQLTRAEARPIAPVVIAQEPRANTPEPPRAGGGRVLHLQVVAADTQEPVPNGPVATVLRPDGKPLAGARVYSAERGEGMSLNDGVVYRRVRAREVLTGPDGAFPIPQRAKPFVVLILGDDAYAIATKKTLSESPNVRAGPYGRIEGRYFAGSRPAAHQPIELCGFLQGEPTMSCRLHFGAKATTGLLGEFTFTRVIPMPHLRIARRDHSGTPGWVCSIGETVHAAPGETTQVIIGGKGRAVVGHVEPPVGWNKPVDFTDECAASVETNRPVRPVPLELLRGKRSLRDSGWSNWIRTWRQSPEGLAHEDSRVGIAVGLALDGSFRIEDLPAGDYRLVVRINEKDWGRERGPFARVMREFTIPPMPRGRSDEPFDLGAVRLEARSTLEAGDPAPPFAVTTVDGKALGLNDYQGKYLLLDFGVTWNDQSRLQVVRLNDVYERFHQDNRLAIVSLVMGADGGATREFVREKGERWPQAIIGPLSHPVASSYGIDDRTVPTAILIGPDGKVISRGLENAHMSEAIAKALGQGAP